MFKNRTTLFFLIASTLHAVAFMPSNYLLPQMFQGVNGSGALKSGIDLLPYACGVSWSTVIGKPLLHLLSKSQADQGSRLDQLSIENSKTSSLGRIRSSWNWNDLILHFLQIPNSLRFTRGVTSRHSCRSGVISINPNPHLASCNAIERDGSCY